jgi:hypothetical protein
MNFSFDCEKLFGCDCDGFAIIESSSKEFMKIMNYSFLCEIINKLGNLSAIVKNL